MKGQNHLNVMFAQKYLYISFSLKYITELIQEKNLLLVKFVIKSFLKKIDKLNIKQLTFVFNILTVEFISKNILVREV